MEHLATEVVEALRRAGAVFALVFGPRARGTQRPDSALDVHREFLEADLGR